jgi:ribose transport system ATP-binding protein
MTQPAMPTSPPPAVEVIDLRKAYGGIQALTGVDLAIASGTVHAVVGENGAGKSTLMKILAGAVQPDAGEVRVDGVAVRFASPADARKVGLGIVYQELSLFPERSILANLFPDDQPTRLGLVDRTEMRRRAAPVLARIGLDVDPDTLVGELGVGERQLVELSRLLIERPSVLILDEPNSALNERETRRLFAILRELSAGAMTIIYVSHRLEEVFDIADRITVLRNGALVTTADRAATTIPRVVEAMVGTSPAALFPERPSPRPGAAGVGGAASTAGDPGAASIVVEGLTVDDELREVSFAVQPGQIVGLAGLEGSGVATLLGVLFGTRRPDAGTIRFADGRGVPASPTAAARRRISLVPADRRNQGLMLERSVAMNIAQVAVGTLTSRRPWLDRRAMGRAARRQIDALRIVTDGPNAIVGRLSGGNQQKVVLGKWLEVAPAIFLLDDPTRGVDVGAKREIYRLIRELADTGRTVLFRSTELTEIVGLADRILVLYRGRLEVEIAGGDIDDHGLLQAINTGRRPAADDPLRPASAGPAPAGDVPPEEVSP